jgi:hypothetical protein
MKTLFARRPSPAMVVSLLALVLALVGTAFAVGSKQPGNQLIRKNSLSGNRLKANSVKGKQVKEKTLGTVPKAKKVKVLSPPASGTTLRGTFSVRDVAGAAGEEIQQGQSFGFALASAPSVHYINFGAAVPAGCSGNSSNPQASPGNLCIFESDAAVNATARGEFNPTTTAAADNEASPFGFAVFARSDAAGTYRIRGSWAVTAG